MSLILTQSVVARKCGSTGRLNLDNAVKSIRDRLEMFLCKW